MDMYIVSLHIYFGCVCVWIWFYLFRMYYSTWSLSIKHESVWIHRDMCTCVARCNVEERHHLSDLSSTSHNISLSGLCWSFYCWRTYYDLTYRHSSSIQSLFIHHLIPVQSFLSCFVCFLFLAKNITNGIHTTFSLHSGWIYLPRRPCAHMCLHVVRIEIEHGLACTFYTHTQQCVCARRVYSLTCSRQDIGADDVGCISNRPDERSLMDCITLPPPKEKCI
jgi:hypothetical protein